MSIGIKDRAMVAMQGDSVCLRTSADDGETWTETWLYPEQAQLVAVALVEYAAMIKARFPTEPAVVVVNPMFNAGSPPIINLIKCERHGTLMDEGDHCWACAIERDG